MGLERGRPRFADSLVRMAKKKPAGLVFGAVLIFMLFTGIFADYMAPYGMNDLHLDNPSGDAVGSILARDRPTWQRCPEPPLIWCPYFRNH